MNKRTVRAFALGILFTVSLIGTAYHFFQNESRSITEAKQMLEDDGFIVLTQSEFANLQKQSLRKSEVEQEQESAKLNENKSLHETVRNNEQSSEQNTEERNVIAYELKITSGMNTEQIATILANVHIIKDAKDFEEYMSKNGYSTRIQLGTFHLTNEMDYSQIAKILTNN